MTTSLVDLCASHGIEPTYRDNDGHERLVPLETLATLAEAFALTEPAPAPPTGVAEARAEEWPPRCHVPEALEHARVWGVTCQLASLPSRRNLGLGDFADLAAFAQVAAAEGADFIGLNPLHAGFWSDPARRSPFSPSNRRFLNPLYLAVEWIEGFAGLDDAEVHEAERLRALPLLDHPGTAALKDRVLRRLFDAFPWDDGLRGAFAGFVAAGGAALASHALFEALSEAMTAEGRGAGWMGWPEPLRDRQSPDVQAFAAARPRAVDYHLWLQWQASRQLARVRDMARGAGMRVGLYLDFAVGAVPDGSATWHDPELTVPGLSIGAPPDAFSTLGQDWGLAPLSPPRLAQLDGAPMAEVMRAIMQYAGAIRLDHAMGLARLWLIPRGALPITGAYVRSPLSCLLRRLSEESHAAGCMVIGEDLGTLPWGFRDLIAERRIHGMKVLLFEQGPEGFHEPGHWPRDAFACFGTHDLPTFAAWWQGADIALRQSVGRLDDAAAAYATQIRAAEREALLRLVGGDGDALSPGVHARLATSPCRMVGLQIEDALGMVEQVNLPGTVDEHPNWRRRLPVAVEAIAAHPGFAAHCAALRQERPR